MGMCQDKAIPICWVGDCTRCTPQTGQAHLAPEQLVGLNFSKSVNTLHLHYHLIFTCAELKGGSEWCKTQNFIFETNLDAAKHVSCSCTTPWLQYYIGSTWLHSSYWLLLKITVGTAAGFLFPYAESNAPHGCSRQYSPSQVIKHQLLKYSEKCQHTQMYRINDPRSF